MSRSSSQTDFYNHHLEKVSRSFAFCIKELGPDLQPKISLAYLLFRLLDTIEDGKWGRASNQIEAFSLFRQVLAETQLPAALIEKLHDAEMRIEERELVDASASLWQELAELNPEDRQKLRLALTTMANGMEYFTVEKKHRLKTFPELNLYCYFVAGCIGELLTDFVYAGGVNQIGRADEKIYADGIHFGLFLQKINILKDTTTDEAQGRFLIPNIQQVQSSLREHALRAIEYVVGLSSLPKRADFKIFTAWSLFLGLASYPHIALALRTGKPFKISRLETWNLLNLIKKNIGDDEFLRQIFSEKISSIENISSETLTGPKQILNMLLADASKNRFSGFDFA